MRDDERLDDDDSDSDEQDLLVVLKLSNRRMGTGEERLELERFGEELEAAVTEAGVGEFDGDELGGGECVLFFCGPDVDRLLAVLMPLLKRSPLCRGGHVVRLTLDAEGHPERQRTPI